MSARPTRLRAMRAICKTLSLGVLLATLLGCKDQVPQSRLDEAQKWSKDLCSCKEKPRAEALSCMKKYPMPVLDDAEDAFTPESIDAYQKASSDGRSCLVELEAMARASSSAEPKASGQPSAAPRDQAPSAAPSGTTK
jgi:hypothetical protein